MTFLRRKIIDGNAYFVYPDVEDAIEVEKTQIVSKVVPEQERCGKYVSNNINDYQIAVIVCKFG